MFRRFDGFLKRWIARPDRKPLLLRGARQVGKTWAVREFARTLGTPLIEVNFELRLECQQAFASPDPHHILKAMEYLGFHKAEPRRSLLFLDEIQDCPQDIAALRYFYELMPNLAVIGAGSLLEFALEQENFSWPVGRIESAWMF